MVDFICMDVLELQGAKTENYKMKNSCPKRDTNSRPLNHKATTVTVRLSDPIYFQQFKTQPVDYRFALCYL